jgi:hypothetical protein
VIHGNRQARAATQSRALAALAALVIALSAVVLATGLAYVEFELPWKSFAVLAVTAAVVGFYRLRR